MTTTILNLGAGVQSSTLLLMSVKGVLPKPDLAIFADTQWEPKAVYTHLQWLMGQAEKAGIPVHVVTAGSIKEDALGAQVRGTKKKGKRWASMPYYTSQNEGSREGMIRRQCTREYKIDPINKFVRREVLGLKPRQRAPKEVVVDRWMGISADEASRMRESIEKWARNVYPLTGLPVKFLDKPWRRGDCMNWLNENYPARVIPRSACVACPYRSNAEWSWLRENSPEEWEEAVEFDKAIRECGGTRGKVYVHRSCLPLAEADLRSIEDKGQLNMFNDECAGMCGV